LDDTAFTRSLADGEDKVVDIRKRKSVPKDKKKIPIMFDETFLARIFNGDHWPIHDPKTKWKFMKPVLGEGVEGRDQLKRCLTFYALANGLKLFYEINDGKEAMC
ncbi:hypothetical protein Tco_0058813, partial [Tanacetum coccineum]